MLFIKMCRVIFLGACGVTETTGEYVSRPHAAADEYDIVPDTLENPLDNQEKKSPRLPEKISSAQTVKNRVPRVSIV